VKTNYMHPVIAVATLFAIAGPLSRSRAAEPEVMTMRNSNLKLTVGAHVLTAALEDNASSRDFVSLLPLTLTLRDYAPTEKISDLPMLELPGTRILSAKRSLSHPGSVSPNAGESRPYSFDPAMSSRARPARSTGMAPHRRQPCLISLFKKPSTASWWTGWRRSPMRNIRQPLRRPDER
jgi:hypothetical protein